ncbi:mycofactocin-coupled SDR family oxidoreductase [Rhodococcus koreensis]|uniref:SDR family mycofactocin-dependent oxidoreductase n=1 Tax=Rhodococcus koreensis TaxID=99653 RepID=A0A1H4XMH6_9NOCA|nr:mycofactocin-coupled SDR family oxidoreductase [Rhodococcus koreensis]SED06350.1 SDR family mycofactocin-dependent oxidoreductase [Rhodococcus koreensis]
MGRLDGKVAVVTGAARGQGRAHAVALAEEGATIVALDILDSLRSPLHKGSTAEDMAETVRLVEKEDQRILAVKADARDLNALTALADQAMAEFGRIDVVVVNHGIWAISENAWETDEEDWQESIDVLLTGAWKVTKAFIPKIIEGGLGGSVILTSSAMGIKAQPSSVAYTVAKHGVLGLMKTLAWEAGRHNIRANAILPGMVDTQMLQGGTIEKSSEWQPRFFTLDRSLLPDGLIPPDGVSRAVVFLASDESAFITGAALPVDAGWTTF